MIHKKKGTTAPNLAISGGFCPNSKRSQIAIFVILGILIISAIALFFIFRQDSNVLQTSGKSEENPTGFFESCIGNKVREAVDELSLRGGYMDSKLSINFKFENENYHNITYLCYNQNSYLPCINQKPAFTEDLNKEIKNYISNDVENCFNKLKSSLEDKGYETNVNYNDFSVEIAPKKIIVQTYSDIAYTKAGQTTNEKDIKVEIASRLYEISLIALEIVNQEARFCYSEISGISILYPEFSIDKTKTDSLSNIYTIIHKDSKEKFRFAVRSCAIPPTF